MHSFDQRCPALRADGGRNPKWNEKLYFPLNGDEDRIVVEVKDVVQSARPLGVASILLDKVLAAARLQRPAPLSLRQQGAESRGSTDGRPEPACRL